MFNVILVEIYEDDAASHRKRRSILIPFLILYQNSTSHSFLKVSCNVEFEIISLNFFFDILKSIGLSCTFNGSFTHARFLKNFIYLFIYLWLCWVFVAVRGLSLVVVRRGYSFIVACRLLIVVASRCGAQALGVRASVVVARGLSSCGSRALERRLGSCGARA